MSTAPSQLDFSKAQPVAPQDDGLDFSKAQPIQPAEPPQEAGNEPESAFHQLIDMTRLGKALIQAKMLGSGDPQTMYKYQEHIEQQLKDIGGDFAQRVKGAATVKDDPLYMLVKHQGPEPFESHDKLLNFIHDASEFMGDPVIYWPAIAGALFGPQGARVGADAGFAIDAGLRKALTDHYQKGDVKSAGELASRAASAVWEGTKGALIGEAMNLAGGIPAGKLPVISTALKGAYQAASMEVAGSILNWHMPTLDSFERNAITVTGLNLITHGVSQAIPDSKQGLLDVYAKDGTTPEQSATKLQAQPPVKPAPPDGLQPAIRLTAKDGSPQVISGEHATHADLAEQTTGSRPVSMEQLEADPKLAQRVLDRPETHSQDVIDKASELSASLGAPDDKAYLKQEPPKSGRGFQTPDGKYLNRAQAKQWVKANEPEVYDMWKDSQGGDEKAEMHSADYQEARTRVGQRNTLEGEPQLNGVAGELQEFLAKNRESLNEVKAGDKGAGYGKSVLRTTNVGPRNFIKATGEQFAGRMDKLLPNPLERDAMSFMRDYRDAPDELRDRIERTRSGDNEELKRAIPAMEKALNPTPKMLEADKLFTQGFTEANNLRQFTGKESSIAPDRYSPRNFMRVDEEIARVGSAKFSQRSPHDIRREYEHLLDPLESGDIKSRTFDAVDQFRVYYDRLANSVANTVFQMELKNSELGKNGSSGTAPAGWVELPGTHKSIIVQDPSTGENKVVGQGFMVPPNVSEAMKPILENDVLSGAKYWKAAKLTQAYIKSVELGLSPFHMRAMAISFVNNAGLEAYRNALLSDNNSPEFEAQERNGALYGLTTTKTSSPYEAYKGLKASSLEPRNTLLSKIKAGYEPVDKLFKGVTTATFDVAQRKFKVIDYSTKEAQWLAKNPNATDAEYATAMRGIAKEVNAVYGGLNWDVMGVSANFQAVGRMFILAPDWTFSNVANLKYAFEGGTAGNAARVFWLKSFATGYAMTQGMSLMLTGQMSKQPFNVYLGKDDKGKEMYSSMFLVGAPKDAVGLVTKTMKDGFPTGAVEFSINKASPLFGTGARLLINKDWQGRPITKPKDTGVEKTGRELAFGAGQLFPAPFVVKDMSERFLNPDEDLTYADFLAGLVGAPVYHEGKDATKGKSRKRYSLSGAR